MLVTQIENNYHLRIGKNNNNFKSIIAKDNSDLLNNTFKDPYIFDFIKLKEGYKEEDINLHINLKK